MRVAYICKRQDTANNINRDLEVGRFESHEQPAAYGVFSSVCGARFDRLEILFKPISPQEIQALHEAWMCRLVPGDEQMAFIKDFQEKYPYPSHSCFEDYVAGEPYRSLREIEAE